MTRKTPLKLKGIVGSPGIAYGTVYVFRRRLEVTRTPLEPGDVEKEIERLQIAVERTRQDILRAQEEARKKHGDKYAAIFDAHLLMLSDPQFIENVVKKVRKDRYNVESIVREILDFLISQFSLIEDKYLRERAIDLQDVGDRLLRHLLGIEGPAKEIGEEPYILVANEITPSELLEFARRNLKGICMDSGGATSHVAILASALGIPSIFGLANLSSVAHTGDEIFIDTTGEGFVILHPDKKKIKLIEIFNEDLEWESVPAHPHTIDGVAIPLAANIARVEELEILRKRNIRRIGLFRSEFLFMESVDPPSEAFQESIYREVVNAAPDSTVLRVLDIGSDKPVKYLPFPHEINPAMGFRSIRFALSRPDLLKTQLRAMVRASVNGNVKILFPMVSVPDELYEIDRIWRQVLDELGPSRPPEWGVMVEVPSAVFMMDRIARFTRYVSLGTNDLLQFFYGVDRTNERLAQIANPLRVPFLRLLSYAVVAAKAEGIRVGICGEMAGNPEGFVVLCGLGIDEFSMAPKFLPRIKKMIPNLSVREISAFVFDILSGNIEADISAELHKNFPDLFSLSKTLSGKKEPKCGKKE